MVPFVGDGNGSCQVSIFRQGFRTELQVAIYKVGITQTVSERIKRFVTLIQIVAGIPVENTVVRVRTSGVQMIVEQRKLPYRTREGSSQLAARDGFAKQNIGNGIPCLTTSEPYIQNRRNVFAFPVQDQRTTGEQEQYHRLTCFHQCFQ